MLTLHDDDATVVSALQAGALGCLVKGVDRAEIVRAVQTVAAGQAVYGPTVAQRIVGFYTGVQERYSAEVFPQLYRSRARGARPGRGRLRQPRHRRAAAPVGVDGAQPRLGAAAEARRPGPRCPAGGGPQAGLGGA